MSCPLRYILLAAQSAERIFADDGLLPVRSRRDDGDGHADQGLQTVEVAARVAGQIFIALDSDRALLPPGEVFIDSLAFAQAFGQQRRRRGDSALEFVSHTDANGVEAVEHIELGDAEQGAAAVND